MRNDMKKIFAAALLSLCVALPAQAAELFATLPRWADICRKREEAAAREKAAKENK